MADTFTPKLGLRQYDLNLNFDGSKISADNVKIDNAIGTVICTSTTRPSTGLFNGLTIYETDSGRILVYNAGAWRLETASILPVASLAARNALTPVWSGFLIWRTDMRWMEMYDAASAAWRVQGFVKCDALADITNPTTNQMTLLSTDQIVYRWTGSAWTEAWIANGISAATRHRAKYTQTSVQSIPNATQQRVAFFTSDFVSNDWTTSTVSGGTKFVANRAGSWQIIFNTRLASAAAGERGATIANDAFTRILAVQGGGNQGTLPFSASVMVEEDFNVGDDFCCWLYQASGGAVNTHLAGGPTAVTMRYMGPKAT